MTISMHFDATLTAAKSEAAEDGVNLLDIPEYAEVIITCRQEDKINLQLQQSKTTTFRETERNYSSCVAFPDLFIAIFVKGNRLTETREQVSQLKHARMQLFHDY